MKEPDRNLELKNIISEMKNSVERRRISELEAESTESIQSEDKREKSNEKNEQSLRDQINIKYTNTCERRIPEEERKGK